MRNIRFNIGNNIASSSLSTATMILLTIVLILLLSIVLILIYLKKIESFEDKKESASESLTKALGNIIKSANKIGKKMLNPELWSDRLKLINKSPMELARMHIESK